MEDTNSLRYRIIQLETELRLAKQQLRDAQNGTQYLLNCLSNQHHCISHQHAQTQFETTRDAGYMVNNFGATIENSQVPFVHSRPGISSHVQTTNFRDGKALNQETELLTFDDQDYSSHQENDSPESFDSTQSTLPCDSLIDSPVDSPPTPFTPPSLARDTSGTPRKPIAIGLGISNICTPPISPLTHSPADWQVCPRTPSPLQAESIFPILRPFADHEHNRLMGSAVFIEDMSPFEQMHHWQSLAVKDHRHAAAEWKVYYEDVVRPAYLRKLGVSNKPDDMAEDDREVKVEDPQDYDCKRPGANSVVAAQGLVASKWASKESACHQTDPRMSNGVCVAGNAKESLVDQKLTRSIPGSLEARDLIDVPHLVGDSATTQNRTIATDQVAKAIELTKPLTKPKEESAEHALSATTEIPFEVKTPEEPILRHLPNDQHYPDAIDAKVSASSFNLSPATGGSPQRRCNIFPQDATDILYKYTSKDATLCQTILVSDIPPSTTLTTVLSKFRDAGKIVSAKLHHIACMKTSPPMGGDSATIVFLQSGRATAFVKSCRKKPISFEALGNEDSTEFKGVEARVDLVPTPTRPLEPKLLDDFSRGLTRILWLQIDMTANLTTPLSPEAVICEFARCGIARPLSFGWKGAGLIEFEFADARDAGDAWGIVDREHWFFGRGCKKGFERDPCDVEVEEVGMVVAEGILEDVAKDDSSEEAVLSVTQREENP